MLEYDLISDDLEDQIFLNAINKAIFEEILCGKLQICNNTECIIRPPIGVCDFSDGCKAFN